MSACNARSLTATPPPSYVTIPEWEPRLTHRYPDRRKHVCQVGRSQQQRRVIPWPFVHHGVVRSPQLVAIDLPSLAVGLPYHAVQPVKEHLRGGLDIFSCQLKNQPPIPRERYVFWIYPKHPEPWSNSRVDPRTVRNCEKRFDHDFAAPRNRTSKALEHTYMRGLFDQICPGHGVRGQTTPPAAELPCPSQVTQPTSNHNHAWASTL